VIPSKMVLLREQTLCAFQTKEWCESVRVMVDDKVKMWLLVMAPIQVRVLFVSL